MSIITSAPSKLVGLPGKRLVFQNYLHAHSWDTFIRRVKIKKKTGVTMVEQCHLKLQLFKFFSFWFTHYTIQIGHKKCSK